MSDQLVKRLRELSNAVTRADWNEFSMRIPVEKDRDADFVLLQAADKIAALEADAARFRSLQWRFTEERDFGPGGRWIATVHTDNPRIRNNVIAVIDDAMKGGA